VPAPFLLAFSLLIMAGGIGLEALADQQKSACKQEHPDRFCDTGIYRWVRCPNYLGEIIFWSGNFIAGIGAYTHWLRWLISLIALACIILIMVGSTKRLERKQDERYGKLPAYQRYRTSVPVLFPFVPIYTLKNVRVYLE
jgi:steroid 5-alpha reductase family enzyme